MTQYKHVVSACCSFIHCSELGDEVPYSQSTYPALVAKQLNASYDCLAYPSASNQGIANKIFSGIGNTNVRMICQGASVHNFCLLVEQNLGDSTVRGLHTQFIK